MNREACCLQLGQLTGANWNDPLVSGFTRERRLPHPTTALKHSTKELSTELKTFSSSQLQNLQRPFHHWRVWLKLNLDFFFLKVIGNPMYFNRMAFLHTYIHACIVSQWFDLLLFCIVHNYQLALSFPLWSYIYMFVTVTRTGWTTGIRA